MGMLDGAGMFGGGGGGDPQPMYTSQGISSDALKELFGKRGRRDLNDYLANPQPLSAGESYEADFFGTTPDSELTDILGMRKRKKRNRALRDYYQNYDYEAAAERAAASPFNQQLNETTGRIESNLLPSVDELLSTGFRTDTAPLIAEERRRYQDEILPDTAERFRTALTGSGFQSNVAKSMEDLGVRLGTLQFEADEAAAGRRSNAILSGGASQAYQTPLNLLLGGALTTGSAGERTRGRVESVRPGARLYDALLGLGGLESQGGFVDQGGGGGITDLLSTGMSMFDMFGGGGAGGATGGGGGGGGGGIPTGGGGMGGFGSRGIV